MSLQQSTQLYDLILLYGLQGVTEWHQLSASDKRNAANTLGVTQIADTPADVMTTLSLTFDKSDPTRSGKLRFIPMPRSRQVKQGFFLPISIQTAQRSAVGFEIFLLLDKTEWLAFRYEQAEGGGPHVYAHVQMCNHLLYGRRRPPNPKDWIPDSYPAHPLPAKDPLRLFLSILIALHGYRDKYSCDRLITAIFQSHSRVSDAAQYLNEVKAMLT